MNAPDRIWTHDDPFPEYIVFSESNHYPVQYIRADLVNQLKGCSILQEVHRRSDNQGVEDNGQDFTVTISAEDYKALTELLSKIGGER